MRFDPLKHRKKLLVDGIPTPLKNVGHLGLLFPIWKNKKCSKPPIRAWSRSAQAGHV